MGRIVLLALVFPALVVAAPVPAPSEKERIAKEWGTVHAPFAECEFKLNGKALTIRTAEAPARDAFDPKAVPNVSRIVKGDFEATVKLVAASAPNRNAKYEGGRPETRAGLWVADDARYAEIALSQNYSIEKGALNTKMYRDLWYSWTDKGSGGTLVDEADPAKSLFFKLSRTGKAVTTAHSFDGKKWKSDGSIEFAEEVTIGVFVEHSTFQIVDATFSDFTFVTPAKRK